MRYGKLLMSVVTLLAVSACSDDDGVSVEPPPGPAALVRFINAVPDTGTVDLRFVDKVENLPTLQGVAFRSTSGHYQRAEPGSRAARIFPNSTDPVMTQVRLVDTTVVVTGNTRYTLVYAGRARGNQDRLAVIEDPATPPTVPANSIALQVLHAAVGTSNVDVHVVPVATATEATPANWQTTKVATISNVAFLSKGAAYVNVPVRPTTGMPFYRFVVTAAGSTTPLFATTPSAPSQLGTPAPAGQTYGALPGVQVSGSVLTAVLFSGSTPGSRQSTAANQTPTVLLIADNVFNP